LELVFVKVSPRYLDNQEGYPLAEQLEDPPKGSSVPFPSHLLEKEELDVSRTRILMEDAGAAPRSMLTVNMLVEEVTGVIVPASVLWIRLRNI